VSSLRAGTKQTRLGGSKNTFLLEPIPKKKFGVRTLLILGFFIVIANSLLLLVWNKKP